MRQEAFWMDLHGDIIEYYVQGKPMPKKCEKCKALHVFTEERRIGEAYGEAMNVECVIMDKELVIAGFGAASYIQYFDIDSVPKLNPPICDASDWFRFAIENI